MYLRPERVEQDSGLVRSLIMAFTLSSGCRSGGPSFRKARSRILYACFFKAATGATNPKSSLMHSLSNQQVRPSSHGKFVAFPCKGPFTQRYSMEGARPPNILICIMIRGASVRSAACKSLRCNLWNVQALSRYVQRPRAA